MTSDKSLRELGDELRLALSHPSLFTLKELERKAELFAAAAKRAK